MKRIEYSQRSNLEDFITLDDDFLLNFIDKFKIKSAIEIPTGGTRHLYTIANILDYFILFDKNKDIILQLNNTISDLKLKHCKAKQMDIFKFGKVKKKIDCIFIMQNAFQMFNKSEMIQIVKQLDTIKSNFIVIDVQDFNKNIPYFVNHRYKIKKSADVDSRFTIYTNEGSTYHFKHLYLNKNEIKYYFDFELYSQTEEQYLDLFKKFQNYKLFQTIYGYNNRKTGHYIFILCNIQL